MHFTRRALLRAWLMATVFSGLPSTLLAWWTGGDLLEATRAAGAMLLPAHSSTPALVADHLMWGALLGFTLQQAGRPRQRLNRR